MNQTVIKIEGLSKTYCIRQVGTGTLCHDLNRLWHKIRGKEDPYLKIGEVNDRSSQGQTCFSKALDEISFDILQGQILGIIGRNGAGKSTLLKIISKITTPSTGIVKLKGKVASLLEVGTGFRTDLTGRENIFLNGTIMGMGAKEIKQKLDEIVDFAGVSRYLDTPVKRYSSGMLVRLGFAVAAFLEPDILIVDEVLAVGDAEFRKKAIGKLGEISHDRNRTVLFVSHNMGAIKSICDRTIVLNKGQLVFDGETDLAIQHYLNDVSTVSDVDLANRSDRNGNGQLRFEDFTMTNKMDESIPVVCTGMHIKFNFNIDVKEALKKTKVFATFRSSSGYTLFICSNFFSNDFYDLEPGKYKITMDLPRFPLSSGQYAIDLKVTSGKTVLDEIESAVTLDVENGDFFGSGRIVTSKNGVLIDHTSSIQRIEH
ncbi:MAG: hypothetical protein A2Y10_12395 [Planctomycetes bacterium GWF2_41_51]|nr:MAG: hypothetical protein A2Y10_12395 [Planctomycetes bacterium GWF2_41_51]